MDPILHLPPTLPPHDAAPLQAAPARVVAEWPAGTFLENLVVRADGSVVVSVLSEARLDHVDAEGRVTVLHQFDAPCTGLLETAEGDLIVAVGEPGKEPAALWRIDPRARTGRRLFEVPGASFLNGLAALAPGRLVATESLLGRLYAIDVGTGACDIWLQDERLAPTADAAFLLGANGVKRFGGHVYVTSNSRALVVRVPVWADASAGTLEIVAERLRGDDLAIDTAGALYLTTHIGHSLDRLDAQGRRVSLGGPQQGLAGSTACAFGRRQGDLHALYVSTTGGIVGPVDGSLQPARLVRLDLGGLDPAPVGASTILQEA